MVAKLDGVPAAENVAPISEKIGPVTAPASETPATDSVPEVPVSETKIEADATVAAAEIQEKSEIVAGDAEAIAVKTDPIETPLPASAVETPAAESTPAEAAVPDAIAYKTETAVAQEAAPVDRDDEPKFASAPAPEVPAAEKAEAPVVDAPVAESTVAESPSVESKSEIAPAEEPKVEETRRVDETQSAPIADRSHQTAAAEGSSPSAEELAEALRFLTPSQSLTGAHTLEEAGAALANELSQGADTGSRWVAEAVALSPEEASGSLETEMFRTFAPSAADQTASHNAPLASISASERGVAATEAMAAIITAAQENTALAVAMVANASPSEQPEAEQKDSPTKPVEEAAEEQAAAVTFADGMHSEAESVSASAEAIGRAVAESEHEKVSSLENGPGGEEAMGKEAKGKSGKSNWHQIRSGAPSAASDALEAAKQAEEPKSMAAAASADGATDASSRGRDREAAGKEVAFSL